MSRLQGRQGWDKYEDYIGRRIFYSGFTDEMIGLVLNNPMVVTKLQEVANQQKTSVAKIRARARKRVEFFAARQESHRFIRFAASSVGGIINSVYNQGIFVDSEEILRLRETARKAAAAGQSLLFMPCHRSHIDYVSLHLILFTLGLSLPSIVAGENLNFPLVGKFLQNCGAFWIPREWGTESPLNNTLMTAYIDALMQQGLNFECFIEGTRSRTGKMLPPKFGMLRILCETLLRLDKDAIVVPVSIQYDNVLETESYSKELLGTPKTQESLSSFFKARSVLSLKMGRIDARFADGFSIREFIDDAEKGLIKNLDQRVWSSESREATLFSNNSDKILRALGYKILNDINEISVVMPTALIGTVLLTIRGRGVGKSEMTRRVAWITGKIESKGGRVASIEDLESVIDKAVGVLGSKLVGIRKGLVEDTYFAQDRFQLSYFRNQIIHLFISEAIICVSLYSVIKTGGKAQEQRMKIDVLKRMTAFLSQVFKSEFIYNSLGYEANISNALSQLKQDQVIDIDDEYVSLSQVERQGGRENFDFYCFLLWPFVDGYWFAAVSLFALTSHGHDTGAVNIKEFQKVAQLLGKTLYYQGDLSYITATSSEMLSNAIQFYGSLGALRMTKGRKKSENSLELSPDWMPSRDDNGIILKQGKLWEFVEALSVARREGKNRRDSQTIQKRVLHLVDEVGKRLQKHEAEKLPAKL